MTCIIRSIAHTGWIVALAISLQFTTPVHAQRPSSGRNSPSTLAAFRDVVARPSESTVRVYCDDFITSLGTIVSTDGLILTKASDLGGRIICKLKNGKEHLARVIGVEEKYDLALLKIDVTSLRPIDWVANKPEVGDWVASPDIAATPAAIGVVSVGARKPNASENGRAAPLPTSGFLGIGLDNDDEGNLIVEMVSPNSAAAKAGVKIGDVVLSLAGRKITNRDRFIDAVQRFKVGESITLKVRRGDDEMDIKATLGRRPSDQFSRGDRMNQMGSELSRKRNGFPVILQHDTVIKPRDCGGPLVNLEGKAIGINIARAGRTESYAIPAENVLALLPELKSGKLAPKEDPAEKIAQLERSLSAFRKEFEKIEGELKDITGDGDAVVEKRRVLKEQLSVLRKKLNDAQAALDKARKDPTRKSD